MEEGWDYEVLHHQAAEIFGWLRQSDTQHVSQKLTPAGFVHTSITARCRWCSQTCEHKSPYGLLHDDGVTMWVDEIRRTVE